MTTFFTALVRRRTWAELLYALLGLPLGVAGFVFTVVTLSVSAALLITFVGLPLLAATGLVSRWAGYGMRRLSNTLNGTQVPKPQPFRAQPGVFGWLGSCLRDGTAWRARLYLVLKFPLGIASFVVGVVFYGYGLGALSYAIWRPFLPCNDDPSGTCHHAANFGDTYYLDTPWRILFTTLAGIILLLLAPWAVRAILLLDRLAVRALLGPSRTTQRVEQLERSRAHAVDDSAATLRRIERDLHDGAQARMVAVAMNVGLAREKLDEGGDPDEARRLLDSAHVTAKQAIVELRDLARGIHPPVLDRGLASALATLAAHSPVPTELRTSITGRPAPAVETIAYFSVAELLANVGKHSGARQAWIAAATDGPLLRIRVADNGQGGARLAGGTGLRGLSDRVQTVDGRLSVNSPDGGPTVVTVELPMQHQVST